MDTFAGKIEDSDSMVIRRKECGEKDECDTNFSHKDNLKNNPLATVITTD
tara:strand:- start:410 stop:559 length:150 start_codon:yes stop_codon:yes gene_type:complete